MDVSFVILNYRSEDYLRRCVKSIVLHAKDISYEIVIVNNDEKPLMLEFQNPNIIVIDNGSNGGYAKGCNIGSKSTKGNILFFLNADTEFLSSDVKEFFKTFENGDVGAIAPRLVTPEGGVQDWSVGYDVTLLEIIKNNIGLIRSRKLWAKEKTCAVDWASGAALAIPKKIFDKCNGFDESFFMYFEDVDICRRIRKLGLKIMLVPNFKILHAGGKSYSNSEKQKKHYYASQDRYFNKHFGKIQSQLLSILRSFFI